LPLIFDAAFPTLLLLPKQQPIKRKMTDVKGNPALFAQLELLSLKLGQDYAGSYGSEIG
jgi:hypothetical protein